MSTQQSAQERAEKYAEEQIEDEGYRKTKQFENCKLDFLVGEISGHQRAMDEMSAKSEEGFEEWAQALRNDSILRQAWQAGRAPLLAKIAELELENKRHAAACDTLLKLLK